MRLHALRVTVHPNRHVMVHETAEPALAGVGTPLALVPFVMWILAAFLFLPLFVWPVAAVACLVAGPCRR